MKNARLAALLLPCLAAPLFAAGNSDLVNAAREGDTVAARALVSAGADMNARDKDGNTALSLALQNGHAEAANMLRAAGAKS